MKKLDKLCIIGVGLLGGSIGLAVKKRGLARRVVGAVRRKEAIGETVSAGAVDEASLHLEECVRGASMVIVCTPVSRIAEYIARVVPLAERGCIVTDVGSIKAPLVKEAERITKGTCRFLGGHPMAGSEKKGVFHAQEDLFEKAVCILTPTESTDEELLQEVSSFWSSLGSAVKLLSPEEHDVVVASVSHLPHLLAVALINLVTQIRLKGNDPVDFVGPGFKDMTRIASSPSDIWSDICRANKDNILEAIESLHKELTGLHELIAKGNDAALRTILDRARKARDTAFSY